MSPRFGDERQQRDLDTLHRIALTLPRSLSLRSVTDTIARELTLAIDRADECDISLWEPEHDRLVVLSVHYRTSGLESTWANERYSLDRWPGTRELLEAGTEHGEYRRDDPAFGDEERRLLAEWSWQSWICFPLVAGGRSVGLVELIDYDSTERWSPRDITFCRTVAAQGAIAVHSARLEEDMRRQVDRDPLTGLLSHRALYQQVGRELVRIADNGNPASLLALDLDDFARVNALRGHIVGDTVLRRVGDVLRGVAGNADIVGRLGSDGFAMLLPGLDSEAGIVAERINTLLEREADVTASVGIAVCLPGERDAARVFDRALHALADAKAAGKAVFRLAA